MNVKDIKTTSTSCTDWEKLDQMTDEEIDYSDIPPLTEDFFAKAKLRQPNHVLIAPDIIAWFQGQTDDYPNLINEILRQYMETAEV